MVGKAKSDIVSDGGSMIPFFMKIPLIYEYLIYKYFFPLVNNRHRCIYPYIINNDKVSWAFLLVFLYFKTFYIPCIFLLILISFADMMLLSLLCKKLLQPVNCRSIAKIYVLIKRPNVKYVVAKMFKIMKFWGIICILK